MTTQFYTMDEVTEMFRVSRQTVYKWIRRGDLASIKIGKRRLFAREDVHTFAVGRAFAVRRAS